MAYYKKNCVFCKVARGDIEHFQFWDDGKHVAFLDKRPQTFGHTLVIPKDHVGYVFNLHKKEYVALLIAAEKVAKILKKLTRCNRVSLGITGFEVDHTHIHLVPMSTAAELTQKRTQHPNVRKMQELADTLKSISVG